MQDSAGNVTNIKSEYYIDEDSGYLNTARMLAETGMLLLEMGDAASKRKAAGVITPLMPSEARSSIACRAPRAPPSRFPSTRRRSRW